MGLVQLRAKSGCLVLCEVIAVGISALHENCVQLYRNGHLPRSFNSIEASTWCTEMSPLQNGTAGLQQLDGPSLARMIVPTWPASPPSKASAAINGPCTDGRRGVD
jgi:hypothetical protein